MAEQMSGAIVMIAVIVLASLSRRRLARDRRGAVG